LLKNKIWAYPLAMAGFGSFTIYQVFRYFHNHSILLLFLILFDILMIAVILLEYKTKKKKLKNKDLLAKLNEDIF